MMETINQELLEGYSMQEKQAYIGAIASIASIDRKTTQDELDYLIALAESAGVDEDYVKSCANDELNSALKNNLNTLKNSDLRFALITDILIFAKSDGQLSEEEKGKIEEIGNYLNLSHQQSTALNTLVDKSQTVEIESENPVDQSFLEKSGLSGILKNANIPTASILKGLLGIAAPIIISKLLRGRSNGSNQTSSSGGGLLGSILGSGVGGGLLGSLLGGNSRNNRTTGGLGSILSNLSGTNGYGGLGSMLKNILQRR